MSIVASCERWTRIEARGVDADAVHQLVEQHDVAATLGHALLLAVLDEVHHLIDRDLDARGVVAERLRRGLEPCRIAVVVGAEHVDGEVEAALELVDQVGEVACEVGRRAVDLMTTRSLSSPNSLVRSHVAPSCSNRCPAVARARERALDAARAVQVDLVREDVICTRKRSSVARIAANMSSTPARPNSSAGASGGRPVSRASAISVLALVAVLGHGLAARAGAQREAEALDLGAGVVEVVLARRRRARRTRTGARASRRRRRCARRRRAAARSGWPRRTRR